MNIDNVSTEGTPVKGRANLSPEENSAYVERAKAANLQGHALKKVFIARDMGNVLAENDANPDKKIPKELFNFDLILDFRRFTVLCDRLVRLRDEEDLTEFNEHELQATLEQCASHRLTCFCAYIAARKEHRNRKEYHEKWMAQKRKEARQLLKLERLEERNQGLRKEIGQITAQEIEDYIRTNHTDELDKHTRDIDDWGDNAETFLEMRDTLKDRGMHLQTLLRRVQDHFAPQVSSGE